MLSFRAMLFDIWSGHSAPLHQENRSSDGGHLDGGIRLIVVLLYKVFMNNKQNGRMHRLDAGAGGASSFSKKSWLHAATLAWSCVAI